MSFVIGGVKAGLSFQVQTNVSMYHPNDGLRKYPFRRSRYSTVGGKIQRLVVGGKKKANSSSAVLMSTPMF
jgi:hypothetical protein